MGGDNSDNGDNTFSLCDVLGENLESSCAPDGSVRVCFSGVQEGKPSDPGIIQDGEWYPDDILNPDDRLRKKDGSLRDLVFFFPDESGCKGGRVT